MPGQDGKQQVFARLRREERSSVVLAADAELFQRDGAQWVRLLDGRRYEEGETALAFRVERFEWQELRLQTKSEESPKFRMKAIPSSRLLAEPGRQELAEIARRLGLPLAVLLLVAMALPLGESSPRTSKGYALVMAVLVFVTYTNFISVSYGWISRGRMEFWSGLTLPHALAALAWLGLMLWRSRRG
jgi:lipopolysaccharide export system permease protein